MGIPTLDGVGVPMLGQVATYLGQGGTYTGWGLPTMARWGYLPWTDGGTYLGGGATSLDGGGTFLGLGGTHPGHFMPQAVSLLWLPAGGLSCFTQG